MKQSFNISDIKYILIRLQTGKNEYLLAQTIFTIQLS